MVRRGARGGDRPYGADRPGISPGLQRVYGATSSPCLPGGVIVCAVWPDGVCLAARPRTVWRVERAGGISIVQPLAWPARRVVRRRAAGTDALRPDLLA